jgi:hypothetical protein
MGNASYSGCLPEDEQRHQQEHQKNKVNLKYGTFVYIINSKEKRNAK